MGQDLPQVPQLEESVWLSTQADPHATSPACGQEQAPDMQAVVGDAQAWPHAPQLPGSVCAFTQPPLQSVAPTGHAQTAAWQFPEQQSAPTLHDAPTAVQGTQVPLRQMFEQHWLARVQAVASSWQAAQAPW